MYITFLFYDNFKSSHILFNSDIMIMKSVVINLMLKKWGMEGGGLVIATSSFQQFWILYFYMFTGFNYYYQNVRITSPIIEFTVILTL